MNPIMVVSHVIRADVRERTRRYGFFVTALIAVYAAYLFIPPNHASYATLQIAGFRGIYNSAWIGSLAAMLTSTFLSLAGFYLVKNTLHHDRLTRVGEILGSTRLSKSAYLLGKTGANFVLLFSIVVVVIIATAAMQVIRGEDTRILVVDLVLPFVVLTLPVIAAVSAAAVFFESVALLRGGFGNVVYFFLWASLIGGEATSTMEILGSGTVLSAMRTALLTAFPHLAGQETSMNLGFSIKAGGELWHLQTFVWKGLDFNIGMIIQRLPLIAIGGLFSIGSIVAFSGFGEGTHIVQKRRAIKKSSEEEVLQRENGSAADATISDTGVIVHRPYSIALPLPPLLRLSILEVLTLTKGLSAWWYFIAAAIAVLGLTLPDDISRLVIGPAVFIWPFFLWSASGTRDDRYGMSQILGSAPFPIVRPLVAQIIAGTAVGLICASGHLIRFLFAGAIPEVGYLLTGLIFVPALAQMLGIWSGSSRMFEILYLLLWYAGPLNKVQFLDYTGISTIGKSPGIALTFLLLAVIFAPLAGLGKSVKSKLG
jgi:hypothetical protein